MCADYLFELIRYCVVRIADGSKDCLIKRTVFKWQCKFALVVVWRSQIYAAFSYEESILFAFIIEVINLLYKSSYFTV